MDVDAIYLGKTKGTEEITPKKAVGRLGIHPYEVDRVEKMRYTIQLGPLNTEYKTYVEGILHDLQVTGCKKGLERPVKLIKIKGLQGVKSFEIYMYTPDIGAAIYEVCEGVIGLIENPTRRKEGLEYFVRNPLPLPE